MLELKEVKLLSYCGSLGDGAFEAAVQQMNKVDYRNIFYFVIDTHKWICAPTHCWYNSKRRADCFILEGILMYNDYKPSFYA